jgi:GT2 family glycosyltransferase
MSETNAAEFNPRVAVVIPTHNRWHEARISLAHLERSDYRNFEIVLIEDGCTDGTAENCRREFPRVRMLHGDGNLWWSGAINVGVEYALGQAFDAIVWLNDDNRVTPETLGHLVESHRRNGAQSVICARVRTLGTHEDEWTGGPPPWHRNFKEWTPPDFTSTRDVPVEHTTGGQGVLFPAQCFRDAGLIDVRSFPHYWADHDFHFRAQEAGYKYFIATDANVYNVPNELRPESKNVFTFKGARWFLFDRRSPINMIILRRLIKRHLSPREYRATFYPFLWQHLKWLASGLAAGSPILHRSLRTIKRNLLTGKRA